MDKPPVIREVQPRGMRARRAISGFGPLVIIVFAAYGCWFWIHHQRGLRGQIPPDLPLDVRQQIERLYGPRNEAEAAAKDFGKLGDRAILAVPFLTKMLHDHSLTEDERPIERGEIAARAIGSVGSPAVEMVVPIVQDADPVARRNAIRALTWAADPRGVEPLINALKDRDDYVRFQSAYGLGQLKDQRAVEPLSERLTDPHPGVREAAVSSLGLIGGERATDILIGQLKIERRRTAAEKELQGDPETANRWDAAEALGKTGNARAVEPLVAALRDTNWYVREHAARSLGEIGDRDAVVPLIEFLRHSEQDVGEHAGFSQGEVKTSLQAAAVEALGALGDARAVDSLIGLLNTGDEYSRRGVVDALAKIKDPRVVPALITALNDRNDFVWVGAAHDLGEIGDATAVEPLIAALRRPPAPNSLNREDVAEALKKITGQDLGTDALKWKEWLDRNRTNLLQHTTRVGALVPLASLG